ncbi:zinc finger protein 180 isoform X2 [Lynx rufus]|uniref:zinc finger protein 180 isoform X2 n=1 Tax=Lynx rufus TaxID=61384 RepID=UPI001F1283A0|nr:zinc finger protein 180 isoform X2 [Lynx rufus]
MPAVATHLGSELRPSGPCLCLKESMEERDEKPPGPLKTSAQDSLLPPESIVKVEKEDAGSLALPSPEGENFKIVTVDFTQKEEGTLNPVQRTLDRDVNLENHRDLVSWGIATINFPISTLQLHPIRGIGEHHQKDVIAD